MVRAIAVATTAVVLGLAQRVVQGNTLLRSVELDAALVEDGLYVARQAEAATANDVEDVNCVLSDWEPVGECNGDTLKQHFQRTVLTPASGNGRACDGPREADFPCKPVHCEMSSWSAWSDCVNGVKTRERHKVVEPKYGGRECPYATDTVKCRKQDCQVCKWSEWVCDDLSGFKTRTRRVTKPKELDGADCPHLSETEPCDPIDCEYTEVSPPTWTECDLNTGEKLKQHHIRVTRQAKHNGEACPADEVELCKVDCKYKDTAENGGDFGECVADDESKKVWHKHKIFAIEYHARNGGKECKEEDGDIKDLCPAQDCQYKSADDSPGGYGDCEYGGEGVGWRKKKQREKRHEALYGGEACKAEDKYAYLPCPRQDCKYKSADDSPGGYGDCEDGGEGVGWRKKKERENLQVALYGGEACKAEDKYAYLPCDAQHCVLDTFGAFTECDNKGMKSQWRAILTPSLYGGTCDSQCHEETCTPVDCVVAGENEDYDDWSGCDKNGFKYKVLRIKQHPRFNGKACPSEADRTRRSSCRSIDCVAGDWKPWGACGADNKRKRSRDKLVEKAFGGEDCPVLEETEDCPTTACVLDDWGPWSACYQNGNGNGNGVGEWKRQRSRAVLAGASASCRAVTQEENCPAIDCVLDDWSTWTNCDSDNKQTRTRSIRVAASGAGKACGATTQTQYCGANDCRVSDWSAWDFSKCSGSSKKKSRTRTVTKKKDGGKECADGDNDEDEVDCKQDCILSGWTVAACDKVTNKRVFSRSKLVELAYGGKDCQVPSPIVETCEKVDCVLEDWGAWTTTGNQRTRTKAIKVPPKNGGAPCPSETSSERTQTEDCVKVNCVVDENWSSWSECTDTSTTQTRTKAILTQPVNGGTACPAAADLTETRDCSKVDCRMSEWEDTSSCVKGKKTRKRSVVQAAKFGGNACPLNEEEEIDCCE